MNYTKLKIFTVFAAAALMVAMFGHTQQAQAKGISQSSSSSMLCINDECQQSKDTQSSSIVCINDECDVNFSNSPSSIRDSIEEEKEEEEDMSESIEESLADNE
jgi:predicted carbohydrate-binding protein with CBM5 and CBM33 domain